MKLLKLEIGDLPKEKQFRSLHAGFKVEFHSLDNQGIKAMSTFSPFCFAGLNGSGKSNVLEALAAIFYHLECCVAKFKPKTFEKHFRRNDCNPDAFTLEYLIGQHDSRPYTIAYFDKVTITKKVGEEPTMTRQSYPFTKEQEIFQVSLEPRFDTSFPQAAQGKEYLPDIVVGYSSGENEILSLPFRKSRLINYDKYREDYLKDYKYEEPENSLIYIDNEMSQAVLLACLLYEDDETLKPLRRELGIVGLRSFRMVINKKRISGPADMSKLYFLQHINNQLEELKKCATSWNLYSTLHNGSHGGVVDATLVLDFYIDEQSKKVFKEYFDTSFELFRFLQVLYELNLITVTEDIKEEVYYSKGYYTDAKIPRSSPRDGVFVFEDYYILKEIEGEPEPKALLLREYSDGEHQFMHTMGICLMLKDRKSILLLDEPETHFNPSWRAKFIKILGDSITAGNNRDYVNGRFNVHLLKDIILTSHSPFIISDCMPDNVVLFERNGEGRVQARKVSEMDDAFNTFGTSVEIILDRLFNYHQSIGDLSNSELDEIDFKEIKTKEQVEKVKSKLRNLGESIEKDMVLARLNKLKIEN